MQLRLLSYNIHKGIGGVDRRYDLDRVIETILHYQPDLALLQEVDDGVPRSRCERQVDVLAEATGLPHRAFQHNVRLKEGHYGNAVLSRYPLAEACDFDLTVPLKKRRRALAVRCTLPRGDGRDGTQSVFVVNLHLGLAGYERKRQLRRLLGCELVTRHHAETPMIVGGDFNDVWGQLGRSTMLPAGFRLASGAARTFPAAAPLRGLDRIYVRGRIEPIGAFAGRTTTARRASDHLPLVVDFDIPDR